MTKSPCEQQNRNRAGGIFSRLEAGHAREIHELEKSCFSLPWNLEQLRGALIQPNFAAYGLWRKDSLIAYISLYHNAPEMEIVNLAVHPQWRKQGHGSRILAILLQVARKMDIKRVVLEVRETNLIAQRLYKNQGFMQSGVRKNYYPDSRENALVFSLALQ